jgi:hypothetical protein
MRQLRVNSYYASFLNLQSTKKGILERLREGPVIGDGGFVFALEKRGYVKAGPWTPEATVEHPEAGENNVLTRPLRLKSTEIEVEVT